jgi:mRNA interferase RelE/StbE
MKILQSRSFERNVKKFDKQQKRVLDKQVLKISENPSVGSEKKGDFRGVYVYKFKIKSTQYLLSYRFVGDDIELVMIGPHENYYRDLKTTSKQDRDCDQVA